MEGDTESRRPRGRAEGSYSEEPFPTGPHSESTPLTESRTARTYAIFLVDFEMEDERFVRRVEELVDNICSRLGLLWQCSLEEAHRMCSKATACGSVCVVSECIGQP